MSAPCHTEIPPSPGASQRAPRSAPSNAHRQVAERERHCPNGEAANEPSHEADWAEHREDERERAENERPQPLGAKPEELFGQRSRRRRDDQQLEDGPADALKHIDPRRQVRAALSERSPHERHPRHSSVGADRAGHRQHDVADEAADEDCDERILQGEGGHERCARDDDEQRHAQVPPEEAGVEPPEDPESHRDGVDSPAALDLS